MRKALLILCFVLPAIQGLTARTARDFFVSAPDDVLRLLPQSTRLDMLDYYEFGSTRPSINAYGGEARMTSLADASLSFDMDKDVNMQLAIIPAAKSDTLLAVITTLHMPVADSDIRFYSTDWQPIAKAPFAMPGYAEWLSPGGLADRRDVQAELLFMPVSADFDREAKVLRLANKALDYLDKSRADSISPMIVEAKVYDIDDGKFILRQ
ncbi:MAG: DUF3256 family protein [Muribaculaceae bacterium]|nr:DUF3256 family protein [Muribaculaceae bacterium]